MEKNVLNTDLTGKVAVVTGASRGIGAATARRFARGGWDVSIHYHRSEEQARALAPLERACELAGVDPVGVYTAEELCDAFLKQSDADAAAHALAQGRLVYDAAAQCDHHHGQEHAHHHGACAEHGCGQHGCGHAPGGDGK